MIIQNYYFKPNKSGIQVKFDWSQTDFPGFNNTGRPGQGVVFSAGAMTAFITEGEPGETQKNFYFEPGTYHIGPHSLQGADMVYIQNGILDRKLRVNIYGAGRGQTIFKYFGHNYSQDQVIKGDYGTEQTVFLSRQDDYLEEFNLANCTIDANFPEQGQITNFALNSLGYKLAAISVRANSGSITRVDVINCAAINDTVNNTLAKECFPVLWYAKDAKSNAVLIEEVSVTKFHAGRGGYATVLSAINFKKDREVPVYYAGTDLRDVVPCITIRNCYAEGARWTNAFGSSGTNYGEYLASRYIRFENNRAKNHNFMFNQDTGSVSHIDYIGNHAENVTNVGQIVSAGTPPFMYNIRAFNNTVLVSDPEYLNKGTNHQLILKGGPTGIVERNNSYSSPLDTPVPVPEPPKPDKPKKKGFFTRVIDWVKNLFD